MTGRTRREFASALVFAGSAMAPENKAAALFRALPLNQRRNVCLRWDDPRRETLSAAAGEFTPMQTKELEGIARSLLGSGTQRLPRAKATATFYGDPDGSSFQLAIATGDWLIRCGGASAARAAFGGPVIAVPATPLLPKLTVAPQSSPRTEDPAAVLRIPKPGVAPAGILVSQLSKPDAAEVRRLLESAVHLFRAAEAADALRQIEKAGGMGALSVAVYPDNAWSLESPTAVIYSHRRVWMNIRYA